jgi:hypothetical protein
LQINRGCRGGGGTQVVAERKPHTPASDRDPLVGACKPRTGEQAADGDTSDNGGGRRHRGALREHAC